MADYIIVKNQRGVSQIWSHFGLKKNTVDGRIEENVAICKHCDVVVKCAGGGTSNMTQHLRRHHPALEPKSKVKVGSPENPKPDIQSPSVCDTPLKNSQYTISNMFLHKYSAKSPKAVNITNKIARFIVKDLRPYRIVDSPEFRDVVKTLNPQYNMPSRKQFSETVVPKLYNEVKADVKAKLGRASQVALTSDGWTSRATESFVTITATFIDVDWEIVNYVLQTRPLPESHSAENIAGVIRNAVTEWNLPTFLGLPPLVSDNAANMIKAGKVLGTPTHIGCLAHTINLAAQKALKIKNVAHVLSRIRSVVSFFHRSAVASGILKTKAELLSLPYHKLKADVCTRWNSAYDMVSRFLEMQPAIVATLRCKEIKDKENCSLNDSNISLAEEISSTLRPLKEITTMLCTESSPTVSVITPLLNQLTSAILDENEEDSSTVSEMKKVMKSDLSERYTEKSEFLNMATALDPRFKGLPFLPDEKRFAVFTKVTEEAVRVSSVLSHKLPVNIKIEDTRSPETMDFSAATLPVPPLPELPKLPQLPKLPELPASDQDADSESQPVTVKQELAESNMPIPSNSCALHNLLGDVFVTHVEPAKSLSEQAELEVVQYKSERPISLSENPLLWWKKHETKYPILSKLAKSLLCIPATSVPSERVFSTAGDILTAQRANLKAKHVDALIFLKKNMK